MSDTLAVVLVFGALLCAILAGAVAGNRGLSVGLYFILGLLLGVIGVLLAAVAPRPTPPGWYPDPWGHGGLRWFDGVRWTYHVGGPAS